MNLSPIVLFVYNRPRHTQKTIKALQNNELASESELFIYADNAKNNKIDEKVLKVRSYIKKINGFKKVTIIEREKNWGLSKSIIDGVTKVINKYGRVIVMEDDLLVSPYFLKYMNASLCKYEEEVKVIQIAGYMFPLTINIKEDALFLPLTSSWGWATWKRSWDLLDINATGYEQLKNDPLLRDRFNLNGACDYFSMMEDQRAGRVDSWAIRFYLTAFISDALTLYPRETLVINNGFDGSGIHGRTNSNLDSFANVSNFKINTIIFPKKIRLCSSWDIINLNLFKIFAKHTMWQRIKSYLIFMIKTIYHNYKP